jgi:hypothetical protein
MSHIHLCGEGDMSDRISSGKILAILCRRGKAHYRDQKQQNQTGSAEYARRKLPVRRLTSTMRFVLHVFRGKLAPEPSIRLDALFSPIVK